MVNNYLDPPIFYHVFMDSVAIGGFSIAQKTHLMIHIYFLRIRLSVHP